MDENNRFIRVKDQSLITKHDQLIQSLEEASQRLAERVDSEERSNLGSQYEAFRKKLTGFDSIFPDDGYSDQEFDDSHLKTKIGIISDQLKFIESKQGLVLRPQSKPGAKVLHYPIELPKPKIIESYTKLDVVYQDVKWDDPRIERDTRGKRYRLGTIGNTVHVFDLLTRLKIGAFDVNVGGIEFEGNSPSILQLFGNENFAYIWKYTRRIGNAAIFHLPSFQEVIMDGGWPSHVHGPITDALGNIGFYIGDSGLDGSAPEEVADVDDLLNKYKLKFTPIEPIHQKIGGRKLDLRPFLKDYPSLNGKIGIFSRYSPQDSSGKAVLSERPINAAEGTKFPCLRYRDLLLRDGFRNGARNRTLVRAIEIDGHSIVFHNDDSGRLSSSVLDFDTLAMRQVGWSGPSFVSRLRTDSQVDASKGVISSEWATSNDHQEVFRFKGRKKQIALPPEPYPNEHMNSLYDYSDSKDGFPIYVGYWHPREGRVKDACMGIYSGRSEKWVREFSIKRLNREVEMQPPSHFMLKDRSSIWLSVPSSKDYDDKKGVYEMRENFLEQISLPAGKRMSQIKGITDFEVFAVSDDWIVGLPKMDQPYLEMWSRKPLCRVLQCTWGVDGDVALFDENGYYTGRGSALRNVAMKADDRVYPFEQYDAKLNRPDIIYKKLGYPEDITNQMSDACRRRLKRLGITEDRLDAENYLPTIQIDGKIEGTTNSDELDLPIVATDRLGKLKSLKVFVNGVPVNGIDGQSWGDSKDTRRVIKVKLASGRNKIQVSVLNSAGAESLYATAEVVNTSVRAKPVLHVISIGVSKYAAKEFNLRYAAKDAEDVAAKLRAGARGLYKDYRELLLKDESVQKEALIRIQKFLAEVKIDDSVVLFMAGHGILDDRYDYYFGTTDIDPLNPRGRGIAFQEVENLLGGVSCLRKLVLLDTCHAGELDTSEKADLSVTDSSPLSNRTPVNVGQHVAVRSVGARGLKSKPVVGAKGMTEWHDRIQNMLIDLRRGGGTTVISSSAGAEYAFESSEQANGLFTYALLEGLSGSGPAAPNGSVVKVSQLVDYVKTRVGQLTQNKQTPNVRRINLEEDFPLVAP